jgi:hypothetical protein
MGKHTDVVTYHRDESPFGEELPVPGYIHRVPRAGAPGGVATMVIERVEVVDDTVTAAITTYDGPLCPVPVSALGPIDDEVSSQAELFPEVASEESRRSHPAGRTATLPRRA